METKCGTDAYLDYLLAEIARFDKLVDTIGGEFTVDAVAYNSCARCLRAARDMYLKLERAKERDAK